MRSRANRANREGGENSDREFRIFAAGEPGSCRNHGDDRCGSDQRMRDRSMAAQECGRSA